MSLARTAQCSAVIPSASDALTSGRCCRRARRTTNISCRFASNLDASRTDSKLVDIAIEFIRKRYHKVRNRRFLCGLDVTITLHLTRGATYQKRRQIQSRVRIALAHTAAVKNERMIQQ